MSYARFSNTSDVYVFAHVGGYVQCCGCKLGDSWDTIVNFDTAEGIAEHMHEHERAGHRLTEDLMDPDTYPDEDFIAMCGTFMCREPIDHQGDHTPVKSERHAAIRARVNT